MQFVDVEPGTEAPRDLSVDSGVRKHITAAIAAHRPNPDADLIEQNVTEGRAAIRRASNDGKQVKEFADLRPDDRRRLQIRSAVTQEKLKAANTPPAEKFIQEGPQKFIHNQPPASWDAEAKAEWDKLPEKVRLAALREQNQNLESFSPLVRRHQELEAAIGPHRNSIPKGLNESQAIDAMFRWSQALSSPDRNQRAVNFAQLMAQNDMSLQDIANVVAQAQQQQPQPVDAGLHAQIEQTMTSFARTHPHFEAVRWQMGRLMTEHPERYEGDENAALERAYRDALAGQNTPQAGGQRAGEMQERIAKFAEGRPYFAAARVAMGHLMQADEARYSHDEAGMAKAYDDVCRIYGYGRDKKSKREAAVSPSTRSPSAAPVSKAGKGMGIRASIRAAINESRGHL